MAQTNLGRILIMWKERYDANTSYSKLDAVELDGSSYLCLKNCTGIPVSNREYWGCIAQRGKDGNTHWSDLSSEEKNEILNSISSSVLGIVNAGGFFVTDSNGKSVMQYTDDGFDVVALSEHFKQLLQDLDFVGLQIGTTTGTAYDGALGASLAGQVKKLNGLLDLGNKIVNTEEEGFFVVDEDGYIGFEVNNNLIKPSALNFKIVD